MLLSPVSHMSARLVLCYLNTSHQNNDTIMAPTEMPTITQRLRRDRRNGSCVLTHREKWKRKVLNSCSRLHLDGIQTDNTIYFKIEREKMRETHNLLFIKSRIRFLTLNFVQSVLMFNVFNIILFPWLMSCSVQTVFNLCYQSTRIIKLFIKLIFCLDWMGWWNVTRSVSLMI